MGRTRTPSGSSDPSAWNPTPAPSCGSDGSCQRALRAAREQRRLATTLAGVDALLMPVSAGIAPRADAWDGLGAMRAFGRQSRLIPFAPPWNLVGWPALALPAGHDPNGVPIGVQLVAAPGREPALVALAAQLESAQPWAPARATLPVA